ncbi:uncharacterized protein LOC144826162 [Lissotriton helveticus]
MQKQKQKQLECGRLTGSTTPLNVFLFVYYFLHEPQNPGASRIQGPSRRVNHHLHRAPLLRILLLSPVQNPYHRPVPTGTAAQLQRSRRGQEEQRHLHQQQWGGEPTAAGDVTPSQKPTRKELAVRARQRKLQAIVEAYRRLVDQAEEEEEEAAAAAAASSNAPGPKPAGLRRRGQAAARRRVVTSSAAPPQQQQHACKCRCRDFQAKILRRVASKLEEERKKLEDGLEERVKIMVDKHLKARRL